MRKTILIIGLVFSAITLSGCIEKSPAETGAPETTVSPVTQPTTTEKPPTTTVVPETISPIIHPPITETSVKPEAVKFSLSSAGFKDGERIPAKYTCDGEDLSPTLSWGAPPERTKSLALIVDDPDAPGGTFTHWVLFNLPVTTQGLPEGVPKHKALERGDLQGVNDFGEIGYNGPCPPPGPEHTYRFHLYALDSELNLLSGATKQEVLKAMEGHILAETQLRGKYGGTK